MSRLVRPALLGIALAVATSGCDSEPSTGPPPPPSVDANGNPTPEAIEKATPPKGIKGGGAPITPGR